jgi:hypothetical protein
MGTTTRWRPDDRWEGFHVYKNPGGTFHILAVDRSGGFTFADGFQTQEHAEWTAALLNAAIGKLPARSA